MYRFGQFIYRNKLKMIALWVIAIIGLSFFALKLPDVLSGNGFEFNGEYKKTRSILEEDFKLPKSNIIVLFERGEDVSDSDWTSTIDRNLDRAGKLDNVKGVTSPLEQHSMLKDNIAYAVLSFDEKAENMGDAVGQLRSVLKDKNGVSVSITGEPVMVKDLNEASQKDLAKAEMIGLPIALIVLILAFGSLVAASIPLLIGLVSILAAMGIVYFYSYSFDLTIFILNIVPMIGLSLSIDFALLLINRFKEEIRLKPVEEAIASTLATAGRSIVFSAMCVFIGLFGLMFIQIDIFQNVALGGVTVVLLAALSALTFLPAILSLLGKRIHSFTIIKVNTEKSGLWSRFAHFVMRRPAIMAILALALLVFALLPVRSMVLTVPGIDALPPAYEAREAYDLYEKTFVKKEKADENKVVAIIETDKQALEKESLKQSAAVLEKITNDSKVDSTESLFTLSKTNDPDKLVASLAAPESPLADIAPKFAADNKMLVNIYLKDHLSPKEKQEWVREMAAKERNPKIHFGGTAKFEQEIFDEIYKKAPQGLLLILVSTFLILMLAFRSVLIPIKAIIMNVLSLSATFGIVAWIFQEGHLISEPASIALILPVFVFSLVFGLSMDYEVFLISRIHEIYGETQNNDHATLTGLISTSKIITSAAAIMIVITGAFAFTDVMPVKQMGVGIALAIFLDATVVRMVLVPSLMKLLGDWNWWFFGLQKKNNNASNKKG
ncbi:MMPL family transporter [Mesobacillus zeae]|uniref:MMPL family transporter n=1 Tax=Mesobacillus zeae TaxID=1917180 RepID=UPI0021755465|nr:MMPL family transporter [Mesobacillus zeae]